MSKPPRSTAVPVRRILVVADGSAVFEAVVEVADAETHRIERAGGCDEALAMLERDAPFDCAIVADALHSRRGMDLLVELQERWPATTRIVVARPAELAEATRALHGGRIFRLLSSACSSAELAEALEAAMEHADGLRREHQLTEELAFTRDSLADMLGELERRLSREVDNLRGVQDLAARLAEADSLEEVARIAVDAVSSALDGRAVRIEVPSPARRIGAESGGRRTPAAELDMVLARTEDCPAFFVEDAEALTARDRRVLGSLLSSISLAAKGQIRRLERDEAQHATVFALARLAERRDNETGQHLVRVSEYSRLIAEGLRAAGVYLDELTDGFIDDIVRSAPLHDIGKVGIPDQILLKPGKLTAAEWEIMRRHTTIGGDTLRAVIERTPRPGFLRVAHDIALFHHEKWNGTGYPHGLRGRDIPLCARIVALADVYDALTTRRPYKDPWTDEEAMELILLERGQHFDPAVVEAFAACCMARDAVRVGHPDERISVEPAV
jgi:response regulator RpfG family c-di-GMP phosphodiesterase